MEKNCCYKRITPTKDKKDPKVANTFTAFESYIKDTVADISLN